MLDTVDIMLGLPNMTGGEEEWGAGRSVGPSQVAGAEVTYDGRGGRSEGGGEPLPPAVLDPWWRRRRDWW